jgi:hypothetical protein
LQGVVNGWQRGVQFRGDPQFWNRQVGLLVQQRAQVVVRTVPAWLAQLVAAISSSLR